MKNIILKADSAIVVPVMSSLKTRPGIADGRHFRPELKNSQTIQMSDRYINASKSTKQALRRIGIASLIDFISFLKAHDLLDREKFKNFANTSNREALSKYLGLTQHNFDSESGDKLSNYVKIFFSKDGHYVTFNYADNFFFNSINKEFAENRRPKWTLPLRMARGITFDIHTGELVAFPYEKFFNLEEYLDGNLNNFAKKMADQKSVAVEKIDGIMVQAFYDRYTNNIRLITRSQLDDEKGFLESADKLLKRTGHYVSLKNYLRNSRKSLMFDLVDPRYRVVVGYGSKSALVLHGIRDLQSLEVLDFAQVQEVAEKFKLDSPTVHNFVSLEELVDFQKNSKDNLEGYVIRFEDESMIKVKTEAYFAKLKGLKALSYRLIANSILLGEDWNSFKYEKIKSEELFDAADKYRADILKQSDCFHRFLSGFVDKLLATTTWTDYGAEERECAKIELQNAFNHAVTKDIVDPNKFEAEDFRIAMNHLFNYSFSKDDKDRDLYNKKLMQLTIDALKNDKWMGGKLTKDVGDAWPASISMSNAGMGQDIQGAGLATVDPKKKSITKLSDKERVKREKQKME